ncbi:hypothetical protein LTS17_001700 [Exophiala oligosperma]
MRFHSASFTYMATLVSLVHVKADSSVFSQFIGATTASGPSSGDLATSFSICTNYLHVLPALTSLTPQLSTQLEQIAVDGVCDFCTGLDQSRIESCCGQTTSSACFDQFAGKAAQSTPASADATATSTSDGTGGLSSTPTQTASGTSNNGVMIKNKDLVASSFAAVMIGFAAWVL